MVSTRLSFAGRGSVRAAAGTSRVKTWGLAVTVGLMALGPPKLRLASGDRTLETAFTDPFSFDAAGLLSVAVWVGGGTYVGFMLLRHLVTKPEFVRGVTSAASIRWYALYACLAVLSATYSEAPLYTLFFAGQVAISLAATLLLVDLVGPRRTLQVLFAAFGALLAVLVILFALSPRLVGSGSGSGYRLIGGVLGGDYGEAALISSTALLGTALYARRATYRRAAGALYALTWIFLILSRTRTRIFLALLVLTLMVVTHPRFSTKLRVVAALVGAVALMAALGVSDELFTFATRDFEGITTLTGRTSAFTFLMDTWRESPILGVGYASGTRLALIPFVDTGRAIGAAHDALSKVLVELGIIGTVALAAAYVSAWFEASKLWRRTRGAAADRIMVLEVMALLMIVGISSASGGGIADTNVAFVLTMAVLVGLRRRMSLTTIAD